MKKSLYTYIICIISLFTGFSPAMGCTSAIIGAKASATGRPLLWKHRDTGADNNFLFRVEPKEGKIGYVGLFNGGDSLLTDAWMGMNDRGFAIMNTASYNLAPDTAAFKDQEGRLMALALERCVSVADFEKLLEESPKPLGVQANFGVIDSEGGAAYFETNDYEWTRFDVADSPSGFLVRSNYSVSGEDGTGYGYIRYNTAVKFIEEAASAEDISPELLTETLSRSFYHSLIGRDLYGDSIVANLDFIPRDISTSSIVVEGVCSGQPADSIRMWAALGYPPCAVTDMVKLNEIPSGFLPDSSWRSPACDKALKLRKSTIPYSGGSGPKYIDMTILRPINEECRKLSLENYRKK